MTKEEYVKTLEKIAADNAVDAKHDDYYDGYFDGLKKAIKLTKELDEPKQVIIPEFIANDIKYHKKCGYTLLGALGSTFDQGLESDVYCCFFADDGSVKKYINAWNNGYEVEKEPKYKVRIKGFDGLDCTKYVNYHMPDNIFLLNDRIQTKKSKTSFTKQWLKDNWSEYDDYNNAGLLEFVEVEDDK
ncbi:DUF1642 domain-containing protein [Pediococcus pentosaceus]|uniref:DUF1642 domain-containing protein n=1 Tax=Pediococcus pentosaceus TaxID=1255 RepID=UPI00403520A1